MKLKTIKTVDDIIAALGQTQSFERAPVEITSRNGQIIEVRIGGLHLGSGYLEVTAEVPFEEATRYRVTAKSPGFEPAVGYFEDYGKAIEYRDSFGPSANVDLQSSVKVLIDDGGNVVEDLDGGMTEGGASDNLDF